MIVKLKLVNVLLLGAIGSHNCPRRSGCLEPLEVVDFCFQLRALMSLSHAVHFTHHFEKWNAAGRWLCVQTAGFKSGYQLC